MGHSSSRVAGSSGRCATCGSPRATWRPWLGRLPSVASGGRSGGTLVGWWYRRSGSRVGPSRDRPSTDVETQPTIKERLGRAFDPTELRRIKRLWVRHSIAEERRDIDGLIATLTADCVYEIVPTGQRWEGHSGARDFYGELFAAFPDNAFALTDIVIGPQGVFEVATLTGTNLGPWAGAEPTGLPIALQVLILFPWDPATERFTGERIW